MKSNRNFIIIGLFIMVMSADFEVAIAANDSLSCVLGAEQNLTKDLVPTVSVEGTEPFWDLVSQKMLPAGSALITGSGDLAEQGITQIIHAATGAMSRSGGIYEPTLASIQFSIINALSLARSHGHRRVAVPFIGGKIFLERIGVTSGELIRTIVETSVKNRGTLELRFVAFGDEDTALFRKILAENFPDIDSDQVAVASGSLIDFNLHGASAIVNAANMEVTFGGGLSRVIAKGIGSIDQQMFVNREAATAIAGFYRNLWDE